MSDYELLPLAPYKFSKDYEKLWSLMESMIIVCFVDSHECRDVCSTSRVEGYKDIGARGICYIYPRNKADFIQQCKERNLEWIETGEQK